MIVTRRRLADGSTVVVRFTGRREGDLAVGSDGVERRRADLDPRPWTWMHADHGAEVAVAAEPGDGAGGHADAVIAVAAGVPVSVQAADCAPLALWTDGGVVGAVHAGWRGLEAGVIETAIARLCDLAGERPDSVTAVLGPRIGPGCYEFGMTELDRLADRFGPEVRSTTAGGSPALDMAAGVAAAVASAGVTRFHDVGVCTACSPRHWSWRAAADRERHACLVVREAAA